MQYNIVSIVFSCMRTGLLPLTGEKRTQVIGQANAVQDERKKVWGGTQKCLSIQIERLLCRRGALQLERKMKERLREITV